VRFRTDLSDPILFFETETDVTRGFRARQPDADRVVTSAKGRTRVGGTGTLPRRWMTPSSF
jgi:hypothetical protein